MNADQERWVKFEAETNYNKRFRLTRPERIGDVSRRGQVTPTTETQRHGGEQQSDKAHRGEAETRRKKGRIWNLWFANC